MNLGGKKGVYVCVYIYIYKALWFKLGEGVSHGTCYI